MGVFQLPEKNLKDQIINTEIKKGTMTRPNNQQHRICTSLPENPFIYSISDMESFVKSYITYLGNDGQV